MTFLIVIWYIIIALIPGLFWIWFYRKKDKNPEPRKLIIKVFLVGMAITLPAIVFEYAAEFFFPFINAENLLTITIASFFIVAPIEEYLKYYVVKIIAFKNKAFDEPIDGVIYGIVAGLGFASLENLIVISAEGQGIIILRFATATLMHAITTGLVGYYLSLNKFSKSDDNKKSNPVWKGLLIAIILHGLYNTIVSTQTILTLFVLIAFLITMYIILSVRIKKLKKIGSFNTEG
jgi:RsiW-degrading membrane proteinase PrsW (M82 family)